MDTTHSQTPSHHDSSDPHSSAMPKGKEAEFRILIVDDESSGQDVLKHILGDQYTLSVAGSGAAALEKVALEAPDLILLDILLPDIGGFEVLAKLKGSEATSHIPVIIITGLDDVADEEKGLVLGAVDYVYKPFHAGIVRARVKAHLGIVQKMRAIEQYGLLDSLTNIPNRRSFDSQITVELGRATREQTPVSLLMIDVDQFKAYNDKYGHQQGDMLLRTLAHVFVSSLRRKSDLIFRWGGEEFVAVLPNTGLEGALTIAEHIRASVEVTPIPSITGGPGTFITVSVGVASTNPAANHEASDFIWEADRALYTAKQTGRNRVCS